MPDGDSLLRGANEITPNFNAPTVSSTDVLTQPKQPSKFGGILRGIAGVASSFIPGVGGMVSNLITGGNGPDFGSMQAMIAQQQRSSMQMLQIQQQVSTQSQNFSAVSNLLKARHDSEMAAVNNFKS